MDQVVDTDTAKEFMKETLAAVDVDELAQICVQVEAKSAWFRTTMSREMLPKLSAEDLHAALGRIFSVRGKGKTAIP